MFEENVEEIEFDIVQTINKKQIITRSKGDIVYVFEYQWFLQWKRYMSDKYDI